MRTEDLEALREFLSADVVARVASPWTDEPWQVMQRGADALALGPPINRATSLTTENVNVHKAGGHVYVEQLPTIVDDNGAHVSMVCYVPTVADGVMTGIRAHRNERGMTAG